MSDFKLFQCDVRSCTEAACWRRVGKCFDLYLCDQCLRLNERGWKRMHRRLDRRGWQLIHRLWVAPPTWTVPYPEPVPPIMQTPEPPDWITNLTQPIDLVPSWPAPWPTPTPFWPTPWPAPWPPPA